MKVEFAFVANGDQGLKIAHIINTILREDLCVYFI